MFTLYRSDTIVTIIMQTLKISMNALIAHPDILRWFLWQWRSKNTWIDTNTSLLDTILNKPIDITITNSTLTIFENVILDISSCPLIVKKLYIELNQNKHKYFNSIVQNNIFRNYKYSKCKINNILEQKIDRLGWITWTVWWIIKSQPRHFFIIKDMLMVGLASLDNKDKFFHTNELLPLPPWINNRPQNIRSIYNRLNQSIYYECLN